MIICDLGNVQLHLPQPTYLNDENKPAPRIGEFYRDSDNGAITWKDTGIPISPSNLFLDEQRSQIIVHDKVTSEQTFREFITAHCGKEEREEVRKRLLNGKGLKQFKTSRGIWVVHIDYSEHFSYAPGNSEEYLYEPTNGIGAAILPSYYMQFDWEQCKIIKK